MKIKNVARALRISYFALSLAGMALGAEGNRPQVVVPGGYTRQAPANTARPVAMAIEDRLDCVELEVRRAKDGQHVIFDADALDKQSPGTGAVKEHSLAELQSLDAGSWFAPRFAG